MTTSGRIEGIKNWSSRPSNRGQRFSSPPAGIWGARGPGLCQGCQIKVFRSVYVC